MTLDDSNFENAGRDGFRIVLRFLIYAFAFTQFAYVTADPDLWGHIRFGQDIWEQGGVHATDPFSFTAHGNTWINHEWLVEVLFYLLYHHFDSTGLLVFKALLGIFIVHLLSSIYFLRSANWVVYLTLFALVIPVMAPGFMTRPHLATFFFLTLLVYVLQKFFDGHPKIIRWMPFIMLLWVNCHGGVVAGMGIFGTITAVEVLRYLFNKEGQGPLLLKYYLLSGLAVLINPYGYHLWQFFIYTLGMPRDISEWGPVALNDFSYWQYKVLTLLFLGSFLLPNKKRIWEILILALALVYGYRHQRHTVLTAILLVPYLAAQYGRWLSLDFRSAYDRLSHHFHWTLKGVVGLYAVFVIGMQVNKYAENDYKIRIDPFMYPVYAAQFMAANHLEGNLVLPFNWGEYMIWKSPRSKVSIDGRFRTMYPESIIELNHAFAYGKPEGMGLLRDYPSILVLTKKNEAPHLFMEKMPGWVKIYQDPISKIFIRTQETAPDHPAWQHMKKNGIIHVNNPPPWAFPG